MATAAPMPPSHGPRRSILDLAPLELHCMNALWPLGEGTVREIQRAMAPATPRAYTTVMTIMDRLARKGVVTRHKRGRAYVYRPNLTAEEAREHAVEQVVEGFFEGSGEALAAHLSSAGGRLAKRGPRLVDRPAAKEARTPERRAEIAEIPAAPREPAEEEVPRPAPALDVSLL